VKFLALSPAFAYALLAGVALVIVLLHLLRPPPPRIVVPSLLLWSRIARERKRPAGQWLILLLLALGAGLAIALALTQPEIGGLGAGARRMTLILDNSPSMASRMSDGRTRWQHAVERAAALLRHSGTASEITLMDTGGQLRLSGFVDRESAIEALASLPAVSWSRTQVPLAQAAAGQVHLFTDGVAPAEALKGAVVHSVFEPADNVAVTAFEVRALPQDPTRLEALVQVLNASPGQQRVRLLIRGGDRYSFAHDLDVRAGETVNATFDVSDFEGGVLGATAVAGSDALPLDDLAYAVVPPHGFKRVLLVTAGNPDLIEALRSVPGVRLTVVPPAAAVRSRGYDALVFDRFAPAEPPEAGALLLLPPARAWLGGQTVVMADARVKDWDAEHAVTGGVAWSNLRLERSVLEADAGNSALVRAGGSRPGALITAGESRARWIRVGFALHDSNFRIQPDFPVFLGNALNWLTEPVAVLSRAVGSIEVPLRGAQVRDGSGKPVATVPTAHGTVFQASQPDVYTVAGPEGQFFVVAGMPDPLYSMINRSRLGGDAEGVGESSAAVGSVQPWMLLLALAAVFLLVEWHVYTRRAKA
jgi:hypothetical protein